MTAMTKPFVPDVELTAGQPEPVAANGGKAYTSRDVNGDAGTAAAVSDALEQIASGEGQAVTYVIENAAPGPIETPWGKGFDGMPSARLTSNPAICRRRRAVLPCHCTIRFLTHPPTRWCRPTQFGKTLRARRKPLNSPRTNATTLGAVSTSRKSCAMPDASQSITPDCHQTLQSAWTNWDFLGVLHIPVPELL